MLSFGQIQRPLEICDIFKPSPNKLWLLMANPFVKWSTTTDIIVAPLDSGQSVMQFVLICVQGLHAIAKG
jgi:hypothetical protein